MRVLALASNGVGILPTDAAIIRLIGAAPLEANDERQLQHCDMDIEDMAEVPRPTQTNELGTTRGAR